MRIPTGAISAIFSRVFKAPREATRELGAQLGPAVQGVSRIGTKRLKEFLAALPIFVMFVLELLRQRQQLQAQKQLMIIGAAAALSTLGLLFLGALMSSLPVQFLLLFTHPFIGVPLLFSSSLVITSVIAVMVWLIVYVLNITLADDPTYQKIREQFLPPNAQDVLTDLQEEIESSGVDLQALRTTVEERLIASGSKADAKKLERSLGRIEKGLRRKMRDRVDEVSKQAAGTGE